MSNRVFEMPALRLVGLRGQFDPASISEIPALWDRFKSRLREIRKRKGWVMYGACRTAPDGKLEYTAATEVDEFGPSSDGLVSFTVPEGPYALFNHVGHIRDIGATWAFILEKGLKEEGYVRRGAHDYERYDQRWDARTGEGVVDIYIAIEHARV